jgi:hypothetical protein
LTDDAGVLTLFPHEEQVDGADGQSNQSRNDNNLPGLQAFSPFDYLSDADDY